MADRFPSLDDLDAGQTEVRGTTSGAEGSFLDRERAILGDDADLFASSNDHKATAATVEDGDDDLLGGDEDYMDAQKGSAGAEDFDGFESSFPTIDTQNDNIGPGGTITNSGYTNYTAPSTEEEPAPVKAWREKRDAELAGRDETSQRKKDETVATAQKDVDSFYETYNRKTDKQKAQVAKEAEEFLAKREDTTAGGTSWERIAKLADLSGKGQMGGGEGSTKKRMRELLTTLKSDKEAPGAGGI